MLNPPKTQLEPPGAETLMRKMTVTSPVFIVRRNGSQARRAVLELEAGQQRELRGGNGVGLRLCRAAMTLSPFWLLVLARL